MILSLTPGFIGTESAQSDSRDMAKLCHVSDVAGTIGAPEPTRGDCINIPKMPASENVSNFIAGVCGSDANQAALGVSNKGQGIKTAKPVAD